MCLPSFDTSADSEDTLHMHAHRDLSLAKFENAIILYVFFSNLNYHAHSELSATESLEFNLGFSTLYGGAEQVVMSFGIIVTRLA